MFVQRNENGEIIAISREATPDIRETIDQDSVELILFLANGKTENQTELRASDLELIRVIEDLVDILTAKGVFQFTELPSQVQAKLNSRRVMRQNNALLDLLDSEEDDLLLP